MAATKTTTGNYFEVPSYHGQFDVGCEYEFTYNDKSRIVRIERILVPTYYTAGKHEAYLHCSDLANGGFRNFTICKIQGEIIAR